MNTHSTDIYLVDLDGTLIRGNEVLPGGREFCEVYRDRMVVVSNNSTDSAQSLAGFLEGIGLTISPERLILAGETSLEFIKANYEDARVSLVANQTITGLAVAAGINVVTDKADIVLVCRDTSVTYEKLISVSREISAGARLMASNLDRSHPGRNGIPVPETGAIVSAIEACTGTKVGHVIGKPGPYLFEKALDRFGWNRGTAVVIGDNLETDCIGAITLEMRFQLLGTGEYADARDLAELLHQISMGVSSVNRGCANALSAIRGPDSRALER